MKKKLAMLLALIMVFSFSLNVFSANLYDTYGDMEKWDDKVWEKTNDWTDAQWNEYFDGQQAASIRETKLGLGIPAKQVNNAVNIKVDDRFITFQGDVLPENKDGVIMAPQGVLSVAIGAKSTFQKDTGVLTVEKGDTTLSFTKGKLKYTKKIGNESLIFTASKAPYLLGNELYIPLRDLANGFSYDIYWNDDVRSAFLIDSEALLEKLNQNFTIYNSLVKSGDNIFDGKAYELGYDLSLNGTLYGAEKDDTVSGGLSATAIVKDGAFDVSGKLKIDISQMSDSIFSVLSEEQKTMVKKIGGGTFEAIGDLQNGGMYLKSSILPMMYPNVKESAWIDGEYPGLGMTGLDLDFAALYKDMNLGSLIYSMSKSAEYTLSYTGTDVYSQAIEYTKLYEFFMGDDAFTTQEFGTQTVYTLKMDNTKFAARMLKYGMMEDLTSFVSTMESLAGGMGGKIELPKINYEIVFKVDSGKLTDSSMKGSIKIAGAVPTEINFDAKGNTAAATSSLEVKGRYFGKISMTAKTTMKQTNKEPRITPPEGAKVYTLDELYAG